MAPQAGPRSTKRRWAVLALAVLASPLLAEAGLRYLLFGDSDFARNLGESLRHPELYAGYNEGGDYWKLRRLFLEDEDERYADHPMADGLLGWRNGAVTPEYDHKYRYLVGDRTPVLFYGASMASAHYAALIEERPIGREYAVLWYAGGGYGAGQAYLVLRESLDNYLEDDPVVVVGLGLHDDFERSILDFRGWPKPRLRVENGVLVESGLVMDTRTTLEESPPDITSYVWSHLIETDRLPFGLSARLDGDDALLAEKKVLIRAILEGIQEEVDARGYRMFFLLFANRAPLMPGAEEFWQDAYVTGILEELGVPYVLAGRAIQEEARRRDVSVRTFFHADNEEGAGHPNEEGRAVICDVLERGLRGDFDG